MVDGDSGGFGQGGRGAGVNFRSGSQPPEVGDVPVGILRVVFILQPFLQLAVFSDLVRGDALTLLGPLDEVQRAHVVQAISQFDQQHPDVMRHREDQLAEELKSMYFSDYANAWSEFLSQLRLREARSIRDASDMLTDLGNPYNSPLLEVLRVVHDQTSFIPSAADAARERAEALGQRAAERQTRRLAGRAGSLEPDNDEAKMHPVERRFRWLHDLRLDEAERAGSSGIMEALETMSEVAAVLSDVAGDDREAARYAETVLKEPTKPCRAPFAA